VTAGASGAGNGTVSSVGRGQHRDLVTHGYRHESPARP
jgi:hypothetical protein